MQEVLPQLKRGMEKLKRAMAISESGSRLYASGSIWTSPVAESPGPLNR